MFLIKMKLILLCVTLFVIAGCSSSSSLVQDGNNYANINIDTKVSISETDEDYICVTIDYNTFIPEIQLSLLNLDLNNKILKNAVKAFAPLKIRLGGTLQDVMVYETVGQKEPCVGLVPNASKLFGSNPGCMPLSRWDQLNNFFSETGAKAIFGLNALNGRNFSKGFALGPWDSRNAESLLRYTHSKGYNNIYAWELGNELSGYGVGVSILAEQYADDIAVLLKLVHGIYKGSMIKPLVAGPGGFFNAPDWWTKFIGITSKTNLPVLTHHVYCLGPGEDEHIVKKIFDPGFLDNGAKVFKDLQDMLRSSNSPTAAWVGESGGAWHGGHHLVTNAFASSFWYLDQLAAAASFNTKAYCRQTLIGRHYGLLNTTTFAPNPDYYSALLWHRLMGKRVLGTRVYGPPKIRAYTLCSKQSGGITLLIINLDTSSYTINVSTQDGLITNPLKQKSRREEYHLTSPKGDSRSQTMLLNGKVLSLTSAGQIPQMIPRKVTSGSLYKLDLIQLYLRIFQMLLLLVVDHLNQFRF